MKANVIRLIFSLFLFYTPVNARILYLNSYSGSDLNSGLSPDLPLKTFTKAYFYALDYDTIICDGVFTWEDPKEFGVTSIDGFSLEKNLSIWGTSPKNKGVFQAGYKCQSYESRIFNVYPEISLNLKNIIIKNGLIKGELRYGAGILLNVNSTIFVDSCIFEDNVLNLDTVTGLGSALGNYYISDMFIYNTIFRNNIATQSERNTAVNTTSGTVFNFNGRFVLENSVFYNNHSDYNGSALVLLFSESKVSNCTFWNNTAKQNTAMVRYPRNQSYFINNTFCNNKMSLKYRFDGVIYVSSYTGWGKNLMFKNNLISNNYYSDTNELASLNQSYANLIDGGNNYIDSIMPSALPFFSTANHNFIGSSQNSKLFLDTALTLDNEWDIPYLKFKPESILSDRGDANSHLYPDSINADSLVRMPLKDSRGIRRDDIPDIGAYENTSKTWIGKNNSWNDLDNWIGGYASGIDVEYKFNESEFMPDLPGNINCKSLKLSGLSKLIIPEPDSLKIFDRISLYSDENSMAELMINGHLSLENTAKFEYHKIFYPDKWYYISFPYKITEIQKIQSNVPYSAVWGNPIGNTQTADFYVAEYDAYKRAFTDNSSGNWKNVSNSILLPNKGYIFAVDSVTELAFIVKGEDYINPSDSIWINPEINHLNERYFNQSWNFKGNPFTSSVDLKEVIDSSSPLYFFDGTNYQTIAFCDNKILKPLETFMFQAYNQADLLFKKSQSETVFNSPKSNLYDESLICLNIDNGIYHDQTRIYFSENADRSFEIGQDAFKIFTSNQDVPQIWTSIAGEDYSFNFCPNSLDTIQLKVKFAGKSDHIFHLDGPENFSKSVSLFTSDMKALGELNEKDIVINNSEHPNGFDGFLLFRNILNSSELSHMQGLNLKINNFCLTLESELEIEEVKIVDLDAKLLHRESSMHTTFNYNFNHKGVYVLQIKINETLITKKIII